MNPSNSNDPSRLLRRSLRANAIFSTLSGLVFVSTSGAIAEGLGAGPPWLVVGVGVQLLGFAAFLVWLASRPKLVRPLVVGVIAADLLWVAATVAVVYADLFSRLGTVVAMGLADAVLFLAILQSIGLHRMGAASRGESGAGQPASGRRSSVRWAVAALVVLPALQWSAERALSWPIGPTRMLTIGLCAVALIPIVRALLEVAAGAALSRTARALAIVLVPLLAISHLLSIARFSDGPFGPVPGGPFESAGVAPPDDWSEAARLRYMEIEIDREKPRSLETVFLVHREALYVAANMPERKRWPHAVREQGRLRVRFDGTDVYALDARFVDSTEETRVLADALNARYGFDLSMGGPIWFFALERAPEG